MFKSVRNYKVYPDFSDTDQERTCIVYLGKCNMLLVTCVIY